MELPTPPWYRRWSVILAGVIGVAAITALLGWRGLREVDNGPDPTATTPAVAVTTTTTTTTPPTSLPPRGSTTTRTPGLLWSQTGSDTGGKSPGFRARGRWRIEWRFDCSNFRRYDGGNFKITGDGAFERVDIQDFAVEASGVREFASGGYGHLLVDSVCRTWTVTVKDA